MDTWFIGVDPGLYGYIALLNPDFELELKSNPTIDNDYDPAMIVKTLQELKASARGRRVVACIERVQAFPKIGVVTNCKQFYCAGIFHTAFHALQIPFTIVRSVEWKKKVLKGYPTKQKSSSVIFVDQRFPELELTRERKKDQDNIADAVCIALYSRYQHLGVEL